MQDYRSQRFGRITNDRITDESENAVSETEGRKKDKMCIILSFVMCVSCDVCVYFVPCDHCVKVFLSVVVNTSYVIIIFSSRMQQSWTVVSLMWTPSHHETRNITEKSERFH